MIPSDIKENTQYRNIPSPFRRQMDDTGVRRVLRNVMYKGDVSLQKTHKDGNRKTHKTYQVDQWYIAENHTQSIVEPGSGKQEGETCWMKNQILSRQPPREDRL